MAPGWARSVRWRTAGACLAIGAVLAGIDSAEAVDWQILYRLSETLRVSDNIQLRDEAEGPGFSSDTSGGLDIAALTPTAEWRATGTLGHLIYFGEGIPEERERTTTAARSSLLKRTIRTDFNVNAHFSMAPASASILADPLLVDPGVPDPVLLDPEFELLNFDRISYGASAGLVHRMTRSDDLSLTVAANRVDFTEDAPNVTPHTALDVFGVWTRRMTRRVDGRARASVGYFEAEGENETSRLVYEAALGANIRATPRLIVDANAGVSITDPRHSDSVTAGGESDSDLSVGFVGDLSLIYTPWRDTTVTVGLTQDVSPDALGNLRTLQAARTSASYQINERSSFSLLGAFTTSTPAGEDEESRESWIVSPSYTHALTRHWNVAVTYQWRKSDVAVSNSAFLTLSHNGAILP